MLDELIKKLQEALKIVPGLVAECNQRLHEIKERQKLQDDRDKELAVRKSEVELREKYVNEQGARLLRHDELEQKASAHSDNVSVHQKNIEQFEKYKKEQQAIIDEQNGLIANRKKALNDAQIALDQEKKTFKQKVIEQVNQEIKVKVI